MNPEIQQYVEALLDRQEGRFYNRMYELGQRHERQINDLRLEFRTALAERDDRITRLETEVRGIRREFDSYVHQSVERMDHIMGVTNNLQQQLRQELPRVVRATVASVRDRIVAQSARDVSPRTDTALDHINNDPGLVLNR